MVIGCIFIDTVEKIISVKEIRDRKPINIDPSYKTTFDIGNYSGYWFYFNLAPETESEMEIDTLTFKEAFDKYCKELITYKKERIKIIQDDIVWLENSIKTKKF